MEYVKKAMDQSSGNTSARILLEMIEIIGYKNKKRLNLNGDYDELNMLQKLTAEDQAFLIYSKREKDKIMESMSALEQELQKNTTHRDDIFTQKTSIDTLHERATAIKGYFENCGKYAIDTLNEVTKRKISNLADSILLSATLHFLGSLPIQTRIKYRKIIQESLKSIGIQTYDYDTKEDLKWIELYSLVLDEIEDEPKWQALSVNCCISSVFVYETVFLLAYSTNTIILNDNWGITYEILKNLVLNECDYTQIFGSKLCSYSLSLYKLNLSNNHIVVINDSSGSGLSYDSGLIKKLFLNRNSQSCVETTPLNAQQSTICLGITSQNKAIILQPDSKDIQSINGKLCDYENHELWVGINQIFYKNLLPDIYEKWMETLSKWQDLIKNDKGLEIEVAKIFRNINNVSDMDLAIMTKLAEIVGNKPDPSIVFKEYQGITTQHPLLASYSNALSMV